MTMSPSSEDALVEGPSWGEPALATLWWEGATDGALWLVDQRRLPNEHVALECRDVPTLVDAIRSLAVRGAPAIGLAAAYGICLAARGTVRESIREVRARIAVASAALAASRPTAVNLFWALRRMNEVMERMPDTESADALRAALFATARRLHADDRRVCQAIGQLGATLLADGDQVLTHCNAGGLATAADGTALAVIFAAHAAGKRLHVWVDETRPLLQGARLTAWELQRRGIPATLICDNMAAQVMREGRVNCVVVGADRIAANGDVANKIGTYGLAVLAAAHQVNFYVAAPVSTLDLACPDGDQIPIEQRSAHEITEISGRSVAPQGVMVYNPAFDVTPARYLSGLITELGIVAPVTSAGLAKLVAGRSLDSEELGS